MPFDTDDRTSMKRLREAITASRSKLKPFREERYDALRQYVGKHYGDEGARDRVPVNLLEQMVSIYSRHLAANNPRVLVTSRFEMLGPTAAEFAQAVNVLMQEIELAKSLRQVIVDALFCIGVLKVGISPEMEVEVGGYLHDVGQPFADPISFDDFVFDMCSTRLEQCDFIGNRYRLPLDYVKSSALYAGTERLAPTPKLTTDQVTGEPRVQALSLGESGYDGDEYRDYIELWDIWLPEQNLVVTLPDDDPPDAIRVVEWDGPEQGPYHLLSFADVPGNIIPLAPAMVAMDLHDFVNRIYRKVFRQAERQKEIPTYQGNAEQDAQRVVDAVDGKMVRLDHADGFKIHRFGGADQVGMAAGIHAKDVFNDLMGNLSLLGGLGPQSGTLGQDELLNANASKKIADMQDRFVTFTKGVVQALAWYEWTDPLRQRQLTKTVPGTDISLSVVWSPETREGDFIQYDLDIEPYSMQHSSPGTRLSMLLNVYQTVVIPSLPMLQQQGGTLDMQVLLDLISEYTNIPELRDIVRFQGLMEDEQVGMEGSPKPELRQAPSTTRTNVRVNRPGATTTGKDEALIQRLLSGAGSVQPGQAATLTRNVG